MTKILKKYTTIPEHLYVERDADFQLKRIVDEMQRPGYVLVARQMGKTNLLIHSKRRMENENRIFVYVDLSNFFEFERDCYQNIVDVLIESNQKQFNTIIEEIEKIRFRKLPAHKEYSNSLRRILSHYKGEIVIVLDEIDALRTAEYSDNIFAQIRSNYFSRTNFPEFERLTYILSGVIEPTELIKDRNKSPFNIGEKIYLDDFTKNEHDKFISNSRLIISKEISGDIYNWTRGNPRLTFDLCSEIEDKLSDGIQITKKLVGEVVKFKYLTDFDIAPIDHIRELVSSNRKVRNAILNIHSNNSDEITDSLRKKLYLYGIIGSEAKDGHSIKNPIIEKAISKEWIESIEKEQKTQTLTSGLALFDAKNFSEAIEVFEAILNSEELANKERESANYFLGFSYYNLRQFENAVEKFSLNFKDENYKRNAFALGGICKLGLNKREEGFKDLEEVIKVEKNDFAYRNSLLNLAINLSKEEKEKALIYLERLYESTLESEKELENESSLADIKLSKCLSLYYQAEIHSETDSQKSILKIKQSIENANVSDSLYLKYFEYQLSENNRKDIQKYIVETIVSNNLLFDKRNNYPINFRESHINLYLDLVFDPNNDILFKKLLDYSDKVLYGNRKNKFEIAYSVGKNSNQLKDIFEYIIKNDNDLSVEVLTDIHRNLAFENISNDKEFFQCFFDYLDLLNDETVFIEVDVYLYAHAIKKYSDQKQFDQALALCASIHKSVQKQKDENLIFEAIIIEYWSANLYFSLRKFSDAIKYANITISNIENSNKNRTSLIDEKGLKSLKDQMEQIIYSSTTRNPITAKKKFQRNQKVKVKYLDGRTITGKYKKLEADIIAERCIIIE